MVPVLRSLADSPDRTAEIDINKGCLDVLEAMFPDKGTLVIPTFGEPAGMRFFLFLRVLGIFVGVLAKATKGRIPADHETIRVWGMLGGGAPGRLD